jgi:hypothetical protein
MPIPPALLPGSRTPPPLWYVTNGDVTVGPVTTNLLVRGVLAERVPNDCLVRERKWSAWRKLERIREVAALRKAQARYGSVRVEKTRWREPGSAPRPFERLERELVRARDSADALRHCLEEAMARTGALVGAVHRRMPHSGFVTSSVRGPGMVSRLGGEFSGDDPAFELASRGESLCDVPRPRAASEYVSERLGALPSCSGITMAPIVCAGRVYAIIELGRPDHEFRSTDFDALVSITALASARFGTVQNRIG